MLCTPPVPSFFLIPHLYPITHGRDPFRSFGAKTWPPEDTSRSSVFSFPTGDVWDESTSVELSTSDELWIAKSVGLASSSSTRFFSLVLVGANLLRMRIGLPYL